MYKRDRARKLQLMRQRQIAAQTLRGSLGESALYGGQPGSSPFTSIHIKQEIQIPQVSSLTSSPDSSPSPIAVALGQAAQAHLSQGHLPAAAVMLCPPPAAPTAPQDASKSLWGSANSTTTSPHSLSPKTQFQFDAVLGGGGPPPAPSHAAPSPANAPAAAPVKMSPLIRDFVQAVDDREWQNSLYGLLQSQTYNQCEVDLFELMCKVLDQNLFSQVDWARNSVFFKDLKVNIVNFLKNN